MVSLITAPFTTPRRCGTGEGSGYAKPALILSRRYAMCCNGCRYKQLQLRHWRMRDVGEEEGGFPLTPVNLRPSAQEPRPTPSSAISGSCAKTE